MADEKNEKILEPRWYVAHTYSGYENKVKESIEMTVKNRGLENLIMEVTVPVERIAVPIPPKKRKKKKTEGEADGETTVTEEPAVKIVERKKFPGYVAIKMIYTDESWYIVRNTRGCTGFVGPGSEPIPLTEDEVVNMLGIDESGDGADVSKVIEQGIGFKVGDSVVVNDGIMEGYGGIITKVNEDTGYVSIELKTETGKMEYQIQYTEIVHESDY